MKKLSGLLVFAATVCLSGAAFAATLSNGSGQSCNGEGTFHFVNNQTGGAAAGVLTALFSTGTCTVSPSKVNASTQHFYCSTSGNSTLLGASTNLPGRLLLSDYTCGVACVPNPKGEICGDGIDNTCDGKVDEGCSSPK